MDCRETLSNLADMSSDCLSDPECAERLRVHLEQCPSCQHESLRFEQTMLLLSSTSQPLVPRVRTQAIWGSCLEKIIADTEALRTHPRDESGWVTPLSSWVGQQPRWSWAALGGAIAVLGGVWLFAPYADTPLADSTTDMRTARIISFERPPSAAYPFIDRHTAMSFDGFNDHVGSTLVSDTVTSETYAR